MFDCFECINRHPVLLDGDALREVAGLVHIAATVHSYVVRELLEGDRGQNRCQLWGARRDFDNIVSYVRDPGIAFCYQSNQVAFAGAHLL